MLDLGCGAGRFCAVARAAGARAIGVDVAEAALERARANVPGGDFRLSAVDGPLPLGDGEVGLVWASEVLAHVADTAALLSELRRVLRPGGRLLVTTPDHGPARRTLGALHGFERVHDPLGPRLRFYTRRSLRETLAGFGFEPVRMGALGGLPGLRASLVADAVREPLRVLR